MIPNWRWFPRTMAERAVWYENFATQFAMVATSLGFTAADVTWVNDDNDVMQFLADIPAQLDAFEGAVRQYRIIITEGDKGAPVPQFPANPAFALEKTIPTGMFERLDKLRTRIMAADNYTDEIGALLDILPSHTEQAAPETLKPVCTVTAAFSGYKYTVHATRLGKPGYKVQMRRGNSETWTDAGQSQTADIEIHFTPTTPGQPERIQVRVILIDKNEETGQPSDAVYVTLNP